MNSEKLRDIYLVWFGYLYLAHDSRREDVQAALKNSAHVYEDWGDWARTDFDEWWEQHSDSPLRGRVRVVRPPSGPDDDNTINGPGKGVLLWVPLNGQSTTALRDQVEAILKKENVMGQRSAPRVEELIHRLHVYRDVFLNNPTLQGMDLLARARAYFKENGGVPRGLNGGDESSKRALRRYILKAEQTMLNVANGIFPGPERSGPDDLTKADSDHIEA
jgi:hypothetical protein